MYEQDFPSVSAEDLEDLRQRLRNTRWPEPWPVRAWEAGTDQETLRSLVEHWAKGFDWDAQYRQIRSLPWHIAQIADAPLAYLRFDAENSGRLPIVLTNGWPSSALELVELAERLSRPSMFGGDPAEAVTATVPALPGFPFSPPASELSRTDPRAVARVDDRASGFFPIRRAWR